MNSRQRVLNILNRQPVDRLPVDLWYTPEIYEALCKALDVRSPVQLFRKLRLDKLVWIDVPYRGATRPCEAGKMATMWGSILRVQQAGAAIYNEADEPALAGCEDARAIEQFAWWPDPAQFDYEAGVAQVDEFANEFVTLGPWVSFFEIYCGMRGLENAMMDLVAEPQMVEAGLDRIEEVQTELLNRFYGRLRERQRADPDRPQVDLCFLSDDMGSQRNLLMSLKHWDRFIGPRMTRWCKLMHEYGIRVFYHSDGACEPLLPRLIDCGIDVLNPIQHVCPGMDRAELKAKYGENVIFHGGVENQSILPFGSADAVRDEVRTCMGTLGEGGGYIVGSCHNIQPGTPVENVLALVDTVLSEGHTAVCGAAKRSC